MAITSFDGYLAASKEVISICKTSTVTQTAFGYSSCFSAVGYPNVYAAAIGNITTGVVPTAGNYGTPAIKSFGVGNTGYITRVSSMNAAAGSVELYDQLFSVGAVAIPSTTNLSGNPSYAGRVPDGDYIGLELWVEIVTSNTNALSIAITYTNENGVAGRTTGTFATFITAGPVTRMVRVPLQSGDWGVQSIQSIVTSVATTGTCNVHVMRPLWRGISRVIGSGESCGIDTSGMPIVYQDSAIRAIQMIAASVSFGMFQVDIEISNG